MRIFIGFRSFRTFYQILLSCPTVYHASAGAGLRWCEWRGRGAQARSDGGLLREVPRHHEPHEHREDDAPDHGRKPLRARQPGPLKQRVQHAAHSRREARKPQGAYALELLR
jgi:hypothetical protein